MKLQPLLSKHVLLEHLPLTAAHAEAGGRAVPSDLLA